MGNELHPPRFAAASETCQNSKAFRGRRSHRLASAWTRSPSHYVLRGKQLSSRRPEALPRRDIGGSKHYGDTWPAEADLEELSHASC